MPGDYEYLVRTGRDNRQCRLGPRSVETERIQADFSNSKRELEARRKSLRVAMSEAERQNKAVKAGRTPSMVVQILRTLEEGGLGQHFIVVGTHALYAYEAAASVRIVAGARATHDVDCSGTRAGACRRCSRKG